MVWRSTLFGEMFTGTKSWRAELDKRKFSLRVTGMTPLTVPIDRLLGFRVEPGIVWATCHLDYKEGGGAKSVRVDGIPNDKASDLQRALYQQVDNYHKRVFGEALAAWQDKFKRGQDWTRWIPKGNATRYIVANPAPEWPGKTWKELVGENTPKDTLLWQITEHNAKHQREKMAARKEFFDTVEKNPACCPGHRLCFVRSSCTPRKGDSPRCKKSNRYVEIAGSRQSAAAPAP
jgi:hypothetical protein